MIRHTCVSLLLMLISGVALAETDQGTTSWVQSLTQEALDAGFLSKLPPNVSVAFNLAKPKEGTDVRQLLAKQGHQVRTFNVGVANHADVVIFDVNAQSGATVAYLIDPTGQLRKALTYQAGGDTKDLSAADAQAGLAREKKYWAGRARAAAANAPAAPGAQSEPGR